MSKKQLLHYRLYYSKNTPGKLTKKDISKKFITPRENNCNWTTVIDYLKRAKYVSISNDGFHNLLPKGFFIKSVVETLGTEIMNEAGAIPYKFSSIFPYVKNDIKKGLIEKFKDYLIEVKMGLHDTIYYLKYASDPVLFDYFRNRIIDTPKIIYSPDYFFRFIKKGEIKPILNPREFQITDYHVFTHQNDFKTFVNMAIINKNTIMKFISDNNWYLNLDTNEDFIKGNRKNIIYMLDKLKGNAIVNVTKERTHYYSLQNQYIVYYTSTDKTQFANLQFDEINGEIFNIRSVKSSRFVSIVHGTMFGRLEKVLTIVFGRAFLEAQENNSKPVLPVWLSPIVCRIVPVSASAELLKFTNILQKSFEKINLRFDIDNRKISISTKVKEAEQDWIPYVIFVGEREIRTNKLTIRNRYSMKDELISITSFCDNIQKQSKGFPNLKQTTPRNFTGNDIY